MSKHAYTPGPWLGSDGFPCFVETSNGMPVAVTHPHHIAHREAVEGVECPELHECIANGILIAAAPDLAEALAAVVRRLDESATDPNFDTARAALKRAGVE